MNFKIILFQLLFFTCITLHKVDSAFVDPNVVLQKNFKGWGTSLAWWADVVGGMDQDVFDYVVENLFSPSKLNLNIARYVIGGTTPNNYTCGDYRDGAATESFRDGFDTPYDWNRDLRQRKVLEAAKSKGANVFEAFSNTPPQWLTISGCSKGNPQSPPLHSNLDPANSDHFADYATEVIKYFNDEMNITFSTYSPFNEPFGLHGIGSWAGSIQSQEGCNMNRPTMVSVIESVHKAVVSKNLTFLKVAISDETQINTQIQSYDYFTNAGVADIFSQVNVHGYWDEIEVSRRDLLSLKCEKAGHELWMDEMGWGGTPVSDMEQGLNIARRVILDLRKMLPNAWGWEIRIVYWQAVESGGGWGLMTVPYQNTSIETIIFNSGYYAMEQFSQHIKHGYQLISVSDEDSIAAVNIPEKKLVIVTFNPNNEEMTQEFDLSLFESLGSAALYRTSTTEQHLNLPPPSINAGNEVTILSPPQSVSTLEFSGIEVVAQDNLLENGDFESVNQTEQGYLIPMSWEVIGESDAVGEDEAWRGTYSGLLRTGPGRSPALQQSFVLSSSPSSSCSLYLSAWCSSTLANTKLGVKVNGEQGPEVVIARNGAYSSYALSFSAKSGDNVQVYFVNTGTTFQGSAKIDNAFVHTKCNTSGASGKR